MTPQLPPTTTLSPRDQFKAYLREKLPLRTRDGFVVRRETKKTCHFLPEGNFGLDRNTLQIAAREVLLEILGIKYAPLVNDEKHLRVTKGTDKTYFIEMDAAFLNAFDTTQYKQKHEEKQETLKEAADLVYKATRLALGAETTDAAISAEIQQSLEDETLWKQNPVMQALAKTALWIKKGDSPYHDFYAPLLNQNALSTLQQEMSYDESDTKNQRFALLRDALTRFQSAYQERGHH